MVEIMEWDMWCSMWCVPQIVANHVAPWDSSAAVFFRKKMPGFGMINHYQPSFTINHHHSPSWMVVNYHQPSLTVYHPPILPWLIPGFPRFLRGFRWSLHVWTTIHQHEPPVMTIRCLWDRAGRCLTLPRALRTGPKSRSCSPRRDLLAATAGTGFGLGYYVVDIWLNIFVSYVVDMCLKSPVDCSYGFGS